MKEILKQINSTLFQKLKGKHSKGAETFQIVKQTIFCYLHVVATLMLN